MQGSLVILKNIIVNFQHVLSDDRVVAMACSAANKQQNKEKDSASKDCLYNVIVSVVIFCVMILVLAFRKRMSFIEFLCVVMFFLWYYNFLQLILCLGISLLALFKK